MLSMQHEAAAAGPRMDTLYIDIGMRVNGDYLRKPPIDTRTGTQWLARAC
jgi:hypothetical protein